jgi:hypothetical protein
MSDAYSSRSECNTYFDARELDAARVHPESCACPVKGCTAALMTTPYRQKELPFCPVHGIRIQVASPTFVYLNGPSPSEKRLAAVRNIRFARDWFLRNIYGSPLKAETDRFGHENSEDALTWNVCAFLSHAANGLHEFAQFLLGDSLPQQSPKLYLWGLRIDLEDKEPCQMFDQLLSSRQVFELDIKRYRTEPDIMLYYPKELLLLCEVKFTAPNKVADGAKAKSGEKPNDIDGILNRYSPDAIPGVVNPRGVSQPFYTQLYRNLFFASHMASKLNVSWHLANLVSETQWAKGRDDGFHDPTPQIMRLLNPGHQERFTFRTWEQYWKECVAGVTGMEELDDYLLNKSACLTSAFACPKR